MHEDAENVGLIRRTADLERLLSESSNIDKQLYNKVKLL